MANKDKLLASAQKFLSKGQVGKAIGEYQKLVDAFPKDVRNRQKLAELLSRDKRNEEALKEYEAVAKHYTDTGFYLKAIALFKQMQKVEPSRVDIYHRLAELNEKQGLVGNALTEYRNLVSFYDKNEMHHEAIEVLEKMAELDPDNLNVAAKIAECYKASGLTDEALEKFKDIIAPLANKGEHVKIVKLYERFLDICPEEGTSRLPLAQALIHSNSSEKAIQILKGLLKHSPEDPDVNKCLADAYVASGDLANARLTLKHLLKQKQDDLELREYYVRVCIDAGEVERARDRLEEWKDDFFQSGGVVVLQGFYEELKELLPGDALVAETLTAIYEAAGETAKLQGLGEAAAAEESTVETADDALLDEAIDDVETLDMLGEEVAPDADIPDLGGDETPTDQPREKKATAPELELDLDLDLGGPAEAEAVEPAAEEIAVPDAEEAIETAIAEDVEVEVEIDLDDMGELDLEFDEEEFAQPPAAETAECVAEEPAATEEQELSLDADLGIEAELETEAFEEPVAEEPAEEEEQEPSLEADIELDLEPELAAEPEFEEPVVEEAAADEEQELSFEAEFELDAGPELAAAPEFEEPAAQDEQELSLEDDLDFSAATGADEELETEIAFGEPEVEEPLAEHEELELVEDLETLEAVEEIDEFEELEEVEELEEIDEFEELEEVEELEEIEDLEEAEPLAAVEATGKVDFAAALNVEAELEEAEFYLQQGLYDDAARVVQTLLEYRPELPLLHDKMAEINQKRDAAEQEAGSDAFVDLLADIQDDDLLAATDFLDSFGADTAVEDELSQKTVSELESTDTESHYNLGIAYKEMGLYDDAIAEFDKAAIDPARVIDCITLTGQCHMEAGEMDAALESFKKGLAHEGLNDEGRMTLNFEIGMLHQMNGQLLEALEYFQLVAEKDSFFRDVSELIKNLRRELGLDDSDDDDGPQGNRDRVSYV